MLDNRRTYAELEAKLLTGESLRVHRYRTALGEYQQKSRDAIWVEFKQTCLYACLCTLLIVTARLSRSKLHQSEAKLESSIVSKCRFVRAQITEQIQAFIAHVNTLR